MAKLTDIQIKAWINKGEHFEGRADGGGLYLCYRKEMAAPMWRYRYRLAGKQRQMFIGSYKDLSLSDARRKAKELSAHVSLGHDVAGEKQIRKTAAVAHIEAEKNRITVAMLIERYYKARVLPRLERPKQALGHLNRLNAALGKMLVEDVTSKHISSMYQKDLLRGHPASTNKLREHTRMAFGYAVALNIIPHNPAQWLDRSYAGGEHKPRERNLGRVELESLFNDMATAKGFGRYNYLNVKLLLNLCVRKFDQIKALNSEFDL
ncbi:MAG: Arm DNA-binding domain-containing protein, partial [Methylobacter sp.]|nr:Arm DNA-binding domain-containing protein [Methylobacter sp.]